MSDAACWIRLYLRQDMLWEGEGPLAFDLEHSVANALWARDRYVVEEYDAGPITREPTRAILTRANPETDLRQTRTIGVNMYRVMEALRSSEIAGARNPRS